VAFWGAKRVEGFIAHYGLQDWWLATFSERERRYLDERYQPLNLPPHTLTQGKWASPGPAATFLNALSTWVTRREDASIAERIHSKVDELGRERPTVGPGYHKGRHFTTYVTDVRNLKKSGKLKEAETLLLELVDATEAQSAVEGLGVAPWYYEELANIYRKQREYAKEVAVLDKFAIRKHAPGVTPPKLRERLEKARQLLASATKPTGQ
jgi:hypothetical protein